jgi:hypothetical protein
MTERSARPPANFWVMAVAGLFGGAWLLAALVVEAAPVVERRGWAALPFDPTFQHKIGELMVAVPLFLTALFSPVWPIERLLTWVERTRLVTAIGAGLNLLAWATSGERQPWTDVFRIWCLVLVAAGLVGPSLVKALLVRQAARGMIAAREPGRGDP